MHANTLYSRRPPPGSTRVLPQVRQQTHEAARLVAVAAQERMDNRIAAAKAALAGQLEDHARRRETLKKELFQVRASRRISPHLAASRHISPHLTTPPYLTASSMGVFHGPPWPSLTFSHVGALSRWDLRSAAPSAVLEAQGVTTARLTTSGSSGWSRYATLSDVIHLDASSCPISILAAPPAPLTRTVDGSRPTSHAGDFGGPRRDGSDGDDPRADRREQGRGNI